MEQTIMTKTVEDILSKMNNYAKDNNQELPELLKECFNQYLMKMSIYKPVEIKTKEDLYIALEKSHSQYESGQFSTYEDFKERMNKLQENMKCII